MTKIYIDNLTDDQETAVVDFMDMLPHGSGIDCDWICSMKGCYVLFSNSFHCMNEWGYYEGYQDFTVKINKRDFMRYVDCMVIAKTYKSLEYVDKMLSRANMLLDLMSSEFRLEFNGRQYLATKHMLRDYLYDTISYGISSMNAINQG